MIAKEDETITGFKMDIRILGVEIIGFAIEVDDFKTKWLVLGLAMFGGIAAITAYFGPTIKILFITY